MTTGSNAPLPASAWTLLQGRQHSWPLFPSSFPETHCATNPQVLHPQCPIFLTPGINELAGPAGSGKTQLALQLCLQCVATPLPFSSSDHQQLYFHALFLCMGPSSSHAETKLASRLEQMALARHHQHSVRPLLSRIWLRMVHNMDEFQELMEHDLPRRFFCHESRHKIGILVLDSLANLVRSRDDITSSLASAPSLPHHNWIHQRTTMFFKIASQLKRWADEYQLTIVVINQVTQSIANNRNNFHNSALHPALGLSWSHCINTSIWLTRRESRWLSQLPVEQSDTQYLQVFHVSSNDKGDQEEEHRSPYCSYDAKRLNPLVKRHVTPEHSNAQPSPTQTSPWLRTVNLLFSPCTSPWSGTFKITAAGPTLLDPNS